jgi:hypothetical protein
MSLVLHVAVSPFKTKARLEAEILMLRQRPNGGHLGRPALGRSCHRRRRFGWF